MASLPRFSNTSINSRSSLRHPEGPKQLPRSGRPGKRPRLAVQASKDEGDFVTNLVGKLFGKKALEDESPFGMNRLDVPEMWPAVTDEWADAVEGDPGDVALLRPLLAKTQLESSPLRLAYDADQHGWSAAAFHERVNTFGAGLVVMQTAGGAVCGGYNPRGWIGLGEDRDSIAAFLFTWPDGAMTAQRPTKLPKVGGPSLAVIDKPGEGVLFGAEGLKLLVPGKEKESRCRLGTFYSRMPNGGRSLFAAEEDPKAAKLMSLRCYVQAGSGEAWELDGIIWKTSTAE